MLWVDRVMVAKKDPRAEIKKLIVQLIMQADDFRVETDKVGNVVILLKNGTNDVSSIEDLSIEERAQLRKQMTQYFSETEVTALSFDLGIDLEALSGNNKQEKIVELIKYCDRNHMISELFVALIDKHPNIFGPDLQKPLQFLNKSRVALET